MSWIADLFRSKVKKALENGDGDAFIQAIVDDRRSIRQEAAAAMARVGLAGFRGLTPAGIAQAYAKAGMLVPVQTGVSDTTMKEVILRFLFGRALVDADEVARKNLAFALHIIDVSWVEVMLKYVKRVEGRGAQYHPLAQRLPLWTINHRRLTLDELQTLPWFNSRFHMMRIGGNLNHKALEELFAEASELFLGERAREFTASFRSASSPPETPYLPTESDETDERQLICAGCGNRYCLGVNAVIVTAEGVLADFARTTVMTTLASPDLVARVRWDGLDDSVKRKQLAEITLMIDFMKKNAARQWQCKECGRIQEYCNR
jgi:hypothetical protein